MTRLQEFNARAALCRQLAALEPDSKNLWLAEAERWSRLTQEPTSRPRHFILAEADNYGMAGGAARPSTRGS